MCHGTPPLGFQGFIGFIGYENSKSYVSLES
jgi:hypothetical protein